MNNLAFYPVRFSSFRTHQHNYTVMEAGMTRARFRTTRCHPRMRLRSGGLMRLLTQRDELEGDEVTGAVLAVELVELALGVDAHDLLVDEPVAECVQVFALLELLDCEVVIVSRQVPTDLASLDILNGVVVTTHDNTSFSRRFPCIFWRMYPKHTRRDFGVLIQNHRNPSCLATCQINTFGVTSTKDVSYNSTCL